MTRLSHLSGWLLATVLVGCGPRHQSNQSVQTSGGSLVDSSWGRPDTVLVCASGGALHLGDDSIGPFPLRGSFSELLSICATPKREIYSEPGGIQPPALYFYFQGALLTAVDTSNNSEADSVSGLHHPGYWVFKGDSLVLPGGHRFPRTLGDLRASYPKGQTSIDERDDSDGATANACELPGILFLLKDPGMPDTLGEWPFSVIHIPDSTRIRGAELRLGVAPNPRSCGGTGGK